MWGLELVSITIIVASNKLNSILNSDLILNNSLDDMIL